MSRLTSTTVYLEEVQLKRLKQASRQDRRPVASLIREALADFLLRREAAAVDKELEHVGS